MNALNRKTYTYDPQSTRLTAIVTTDPSGQPANDIQRRAYTYSPAGDIIEVRDDLRDIDYTYTYDNLHRLTSESSGAYDPIGYAYNAIGNILSKTVGTNTYAYTYDTAHKHAVKTITFNGQNYNYLYDEVGNMAAGPDFSDPAQAAVRTLSYYWNNMPARIVHTKGGTTKTTSFVYDGRGDRAKKQVGSGATTYYIGDHFELKDGAATKYVFAGDLRVAKVVGSDIDYYHKDHLSSSTAMTDAVGAVVELTEYMPFGNERDHAGEVVSDYKFTDQELDTSTNLYNYDARQYDAVIGRFVSADSIVPNIFNPQSLNRYSYCRNNPLIYIDPDGYQEEEKDKPPTSLKENFIKDMKKVVDRMTAGQIMMVDDDEQQKKIREAAVKAAAAAAATAITVKTIKELASDKEKKEENPKKGTIYEVPGESTPSGKPYIGRHNKPTPQTTRRSPDGRDRSKAEVIDTYNKENTYEGRIKEQQKMNERGGVNNLDNKRNEIAPNKQPDSIKRKKDDD